jgi:putative flippase GtrA
LDVVARSAGVGLFATAVDLGALAVFVSGFDLAPRLASIPALALGITVQFVGNKLFAFRNRSSAWLEELGQFLAVEALGFVANAVLFDLLITHTSLPYLPLRIVTTSIVYFSICLPLWSKIFRQPARFSSAPLPCTGKIVLDRETPPCS